jgi:hypothetical protein
MTKKIRLLEQRRLAAAHRPFPLTALPFLLTLWQPGRSRLQPGRSRLRPCRSHLRPGHFGQPVPGPVANLREFLPDEAIPPIKMGDGEACQ